MVFVFTGHIDRLLGPNTFGEAITYTPPAPHNTTSTNLSEVGWKDDKTDIETKDGDESQADTATVIIRVTDLALVDKNATIVRTATGETWTVFDVRNMRSVAWEVRVRKTATTELTKGQYRQ